MNETNPDPFETFTVVISETEKYEYKVAKRGRGWHAECTYHFRYRHLRSDEYGWGRLGYGPSFCGSILGWNARTRKGLYRKLSRDIADHMAQRRDPFRSNLHEIMNAPRTLA